MKLLIVFVIVCVTINRIETKHALFEKIEYQIFNKSIVSDISVNIKTVAYNTYEGDANAIVHESLDELWVHGVLFHKNLKYEKYFIDLWLEACKIIKKPRDHPIGLLISELYAIHRFDINFNFPLLCPIATGFIKVNTNHPVNLTAVVIPAIPGVPVPLILTGQYRLDVMLATKRNENIFFKTRIFGSLI